MRYRCEILNHGIHGYEVWLHGRNQGRSGVNPLLHAIRNNGIRFFSFWNSKENVSNKVIPKKKF